MIVLLTTVLAMAQVEPWQPRRVELAPHAGVWANGALSKQVDLGLRTAYYPKASLGAELSIDHMLDLGESDLGDIVAPVLDRVYSGGSDAIFQMPVEYARLQVAAGATWSPLRLRVAVASSVAFHANARLFFGVGATQWAESVATYDTEPDPTSTDNVNLTYTGIRGWRLGPILGAGVDAFMSRRVALAFDLRLSHWLAPATQFDAGVPVTEKKIYVRAQRTVALKFALGGREE